MENDNKVTKLYDYKVSVMGDNRARNHKSYRLNSKSGYNKVREETATAKSSGGDDGMDGNDDYVKRPELNNELASLRTEIGLQFENQYLKLEKLIDNKFKDERKDRKSDKRWTIGIVLTGTSVLIALSSLILGIVL
ncbi:hypothetical protein EWH99_10555 [Sporolactobacillus sp. THM7-7]|nr:hypothetical protein EWH99_10555 [Sporolactobacillus sp. THM7-7]